MVAVLAHDMRKLEGMQAGIVLYRNMKDTIRAQYAKKQGQGAFLEAPLRAYYGKERKEKAVDAWQYWFPNFFEIYIHNYILCIFLRGDRDPGVVMGPWETK